MTQLNWIAGPTLLDPRALFKNITSDDVPVSQSYPYGNPGVSSANLFRSDGLVINITGQNLARVMTSTSAGFIYPYAGTVTGVNVKDNSGNILISMSGLSLPASGNFFGQIDKFNPSTRYLDPTETLLQGNDTFIGNAFDNRLDGGKANDILDGGAGVDIADYTGARSSFALTKSGGAYTLSDVRSGSPDGTDTLTNIEKINFNGAVTSIETFTPRNFNGDLKSDLAWYNDASGSAVIFLMDGTTITAADIVGPANGGSWDLVATGDLNGDAQSDMIWQNVLSGDVVGYVLNGASIASAAVVGSPGSSFKVVGVGDLNADGNSDIVLQDNNGQAVVWFINGTTIQSAAGIGPANGAAWSIKAIGDINGDGRADLVWQHTDGSTVEYLMNGSSIMMAQQIAGANGPSFSVKGIGDINGDFAGDIIWQYSNGQAGAWLMDGTSIAGARGIGGANGSQWEIRDIADLNGDGKMDLVWEDITNGQAVGFLLNDTNIIAAAAIGGANGADWKIV